MVKLANRFINVAPEDYIAEEIDMANNPATRVPVVLCIDCSYSMLQNNRIGKLREGIVQRDHVVMIVHQQFLIFFVRCS